MPLLAGSSEGGGALRLRVGRTLTVDGTLSANGHPGLVEGAGGGSGGSLWVTAATLRGNGTLEANGGVGEPVQGGGGGGGRIALYVGSNHFDGAVTALGAPGAALGQDGSVLATHLPEARVISQIPSNAVPYAVSNVDLVFDALLETNSVSLSAVVVNTPNGPLPFSNLTLSFPSRTALRIGFPAQNTPGLYQVTLGPPLSDMYGSPVDYTGSFVVLDRTLTSQIQGGHLNVSWYGANSVTYQLLYSTNLINWMPFGSPILGSNALINIALPIETSPAQFLRLQLAQ